MLVIGESPIRRLTRLTARRSGTVGASSLGNRPSTRLLASGTRCRSAMRLARMPSAVSSGDRPKLRSFVPISRTTALAGGPSRLPFANRHNRWSVRSPLMPAFSTPRGSKVLSPHLWVPAFGQRIAEKKHRVGDVLDRLVDPHQSVERMPAVRSVGSGGSSCAKGAQGTPSPARAALGKASTVGIATRTR